MGRSSVSADEILGHVRTLTSKLEILPRVNEKGGSECAFAEDLFAQKEEAAAELREDLSKLLSRKRELDEELARCHHNLNQVGIDATRLRTHPALEAYDAATQMLIQQAESLERELDTVVMLIAIVSAVLKRADRQKFPGRQPKRSTVPGSPDKTRVIPSPKPVSPMVGDMVGLGPLGAGGGTFGGWPCR
jgi:hypothetical protein